MCLGKSAWKSTCAGQNPYGYNGIELEEGFGLDWNMAAFRSYDPAIGRWGQIDPLSDYAQDWTPYRNAFNNPILFYDPFGLFETKKEAKEYAKEHGIRRGLFSWNRIRKQKDGTYAIENRKNHTSISDWGDDIGVTTSILISNKDRILPTGENDTFWQFEDSRLREDEEARMIDRPILLPGGFGGGIAKGASGIVKLGSGLGKLPKGVGRIPKGEMWKNLITGKSHKGGRFFSKKLDKLNGYLKVGGNRTPSTNVGLPKGLSTTVGPKNPKPVQKNIWQERIEALGRFLGMIS